MESRHPNETRDEMKRSAEKGGEQLKQAARDTTEEARATARAQAEQGRGVAAEMARDGGEALQSTADSFAAQGHDSLAQSASALADKMTQLSRSLEQESIDGLTRRARQAARDNPGMFLLGGVALGVVLGRFFSASASRSHGETQQPTESGAIAGQGMGYRPEAGSSAPTAPTGQSHLTQEGGEYGQPS